MLLLGRGRARVWTHGGDRPSPFEPYCFQAGQQAVLDVVLSHAGKPLAGGVLHWRIAGGDFVAEGSQTGAGAAGGRYAAQHRAFYLRRAADG